MGYTHRWEPVDGWAEGKFSEISKAAARIIELSDAKVAFEYDQPNKNPEITDEAIRFNGVGEDGHETFFLSKECSGFCFCKTNRMDYDEIVTAILIAAEWLTRGKLNVSSDGGTEDWLPGLDLARRAMTDASLPSGVVSHD